MVIKQAQKTLQKHSSEEVQRLAVLKKHNPNITAAGRKVSDRIS